MYKHAVMFCKRSLLLLSVVVHAVAGAAQAQNVTGLSGPSSVARDLTPGDGLTDPQFRSDFPRNVAPGWFDWKERLAEDGFSFNIDYLALGQVSTSDLGDGEAASGLARFYGSWRATENGSLTFKVEHRHRYSDVVPQFLGLDGGAISITGAGFNDNGDQLTNLYWTQRASTGAWTLQAGQIDVTDFVDTYGLVSNWTAFQNLSFLTSPTINVANPGLGIAGGVRMSDNFYAVGSLADANGDPTDLDLDVFSDGELFKSLEFGYTSDFDRIYLDNIHLTVWHSDAADDGGRAEDYGAAFSAAWFIDNRWMPFIRGGVSKGTAALLETSVSAGLGYHGRNTDLAAIGVNWGEADGVDGSQVTVETFYRFSVSPGLQITPSFQYIDNPLLNSEQSEIMLFGLRTRIVF